MKKIFLIILVAVFSISHNSFSQTWTAQANAPTLNDGMSTFVINNKFYAAGGPSTNALKEYDPVTNTWSAKAPIPGASQRAFGVGFAINGKGYVCSGLNGSTVLNDMYEYDPVANTWTAKASLPGPARDGAFGFAISGKGYLGCGVDANSFLLNDFYEYDPIANTWTSKANFGGGFRIFAAAFAIGNKGYAGSGAAASETNDLWEYNPVNNTWTARANIPGPNRQCAVGFNSTSYGFIGLGQSNYTTNYNDMYQYDPILNQWNTLPAIATGRAWASGFSINSDIYVTSGFNFSSFFKDLWKLILPAGINDIENDISVYVYPNPANDVINVSINNSRQISGIEINNIVGKNIYQSSIASTKTEIDMSNQTKGIYFIKIYYGQTFLTKKIVIQ